MALNLTMPETHELRPRITVFGVGGAGGNAVNNMIEKQLEGVEFVVANTDSQALQGSRAKARIQMGAKVTEGLGAGARPSIGAAAAEETIEEIVDHLAGAHMCFITAGMGGGTGTGAAPIIAQAARELGVLTVGVVTKPFQFEGAKRMKQAEEGIEVLQKVVDTLIIIPNQNLFRLANERTTFTEAFSMADDVLYQGVKGVTDLMVKPGLINLDFADVRAVMDEMGKAMMGTGEASGEDRAREAAEKAIANPLLDEISLEGAKGVLINITGGYDLTLFELDEAANLIRDKVDDNANIIVGSTLDTTMENTMRVSVVATGIDASAVQRSEPAPLRRSRDDVVNRRPAVEDVPEPVYKPKPEPAMHYETEVAHAAYDPTTVEDLASFDAEAGYETSEDAGWDDVPEAPAMELPEPVYRPEAASHRPSLRPANPPASAPQRGEEFVAPKPRQAGVPDPAMMERLRKAASMTRAQAEERDPVRPTAPAQAEKRGFGGINSLIGRMTGQSAEPQPAPTARPVRPAAAAQPRLRPEAPAPRDEHEDDRVEIPAFLRRQAN